MAACADVGQASFHGQWRTCATDHALLHAMQHTEGASRLVLLLLCVLATSRRVFSVCAAAVTARAADSARACTAFAGVSPCACNAEVVKAMAV